jgi:hypothetical protein
MALPKRDLGRSSDSRVRNHVSIVIRTVEPLLAPLNVPVFMGSQASDKQVLLNLSLSGVFI